MAWQNQDCDPRLRDKSLKGAQGCPGMGLSPDSALPQCPQHSRCCWTGQQKGITRQDWPLRALLSLFRDPYPSGSLSVPEAPFPHDLPALLHCLSWLAG